MTSDGRVGMVGTRWFSDHLQTRVSFAGFHCIPQKERHARDGPCPLLRHTLHRSWSARSISSHSFHLHRPRPERAIRTLKIVVGHSSPCERLQPTCCVVRSTKMGPGEG
jgi:hypothetical protein